MKHLDAFWLLIDLETNTPLPDDKQPRTNKMSEVLRFMRSALPSNFRSYRVGIVLVTPLSKWERQLTRSVYPDWYPSPKRVCFVSKSTVGR